MSQVAEAGVLTAARAGDEAAFSKLVDRYRRELQLHCYRMLGSLEDAEDAVQETFLRAWRKRETFRGDSSFRAWLYGIATNACLDALARRPRVAPPQDGRPLAEVPWLQPYPDRLLEGVASNDDEPDAEVVAKETIELAFIAAIQLLPPKQRAVLISRDVLGWSAAERAALLAMSVAAANSALQRARATLQRHLPRRRVEWAPGSDPSREERELLRRSVLGRAPMRADPCEPAAGRRVLRAETRGRRIPPSSARRAPHRGWGRRGDRRVLPRRVAARDARTAADCLMDRPPGFEIRV